MSKVSIAKAAKMFAVSRPTLANHIENGKISGEKIEGAWQIDLSELKRVYRYRDAKSDKPMHADLSSDSVQGNSLLQSENKVLQARLEMAQERIADLEGDRDQWRQTANRLLEKQEPAKGILARLIGR